METLRSALPETAQLGTAFELALLTSVGLEADLAYEGDPTGCPHCAAPGSLERVESAA